MGQQKRSTVERACDYCGATYAARKDLLAKGNGRYCSRKCGAAPRKARVAMTCETCGKEFETLECRRSGPVQQKYCSNACRHVGRKKHRRPLEDRFWEKVKKGGPDECWEWQARTNQFGHGQLGTGGRSGKDEGAHRISWRFAHGEIPDGMHVLHKCDNPPCVNPSHLFLGLPRDNSADMVAKGRQRRGETSPLAKLTDPEVIEMRRLFDAGEATCKEVATRFGVDYHTAYKIVRRQRWTHLP